MRVVYLNPTGQLGGAERALLDILASLKAADPQFSPHLIVSSQGPLIAKAEAINIPTTILPFPSSLARIGDSSASKQINKLQLVWRLVVAGFGMIFYLKHLKRFLRQIAPELIHTNGFKMHLLGLWARPNQVPIIWHIHDYVSSRYLMAKLIKRYAHHCDAIITNSYSVATDVRSLCGETAPIYPIHNGIDLNTYCPDGPKLDLDNLAGLPRALDNTIRVGLFGTLARWKGHETFLKAISILPQNLPIRAFIVGDAVYQTDGSQYSITELRQLAGQLGISNKVGFTGFVDESAAGMRACDIIVHASTQPEPFGLVIIEAMACGRPVIVSNAGGVTELIEEGSNSVAHHPGDVITLAACIRHLARDESLRERLSQEGYATAKDRFDRALMAQKINPLYQKLAILTSPFQSCSSNLSLTDD